MPVKSLETLDSEVIRDRAVALAKPVESAVCQPELGHQPHLWREQLPFNPSCARLELDGRLLALVSVLTRVLGGGDSVEDEVELLGELTRLSSNGGEVDSSLGVELRLVRLVCRSETIEASNPLLEVPNDVRCSREVRVVEGEDEALESLRSLLLEVILVEEKVGDDVVEGGEMFRGGSNLERGDVERDEILRRARGVESISSRSL